ncbi:MAG TPA: ROK family protein [Candidatus Saccharimonadales bacterium]|nr:ROK family protein [Candidatus Saccharimonadales bacterium]
MTDSSRAIGVDLGGSGIKAALVDTERGLLLTERIRVKTPRPARPSAVIAQMTSIVDRSARGDGVDRGVPVGVGIPSVVIDGVTVTAANIDEEWVGLQADRALTEGLGRRTEIINDADAAGLAEMRFGAGAGRRGTVLLLTLGTGIGSALFLDGRLVPNLELGHIEIRGRDGEARASAAARIRRNLSWERWALDLDEYLHRVDRLVWPDLIIIGGGISKQAPRFIDRLTVRPPVLPAQLQNNAGIVGAAMIAVERTAPAEHPAEHPAELQAEHPAELPAEHPAESSTDAPAGAITGSAGA